MYKKLIFIIIIVSLFLLSSCKEVTENPESRPEDASSYIGVDFSSIDPTISDPSESESDVSIPSESFEEESSNQSSQSDGESSTVSTDGSNENIVIDEDDLGIVLDGVEVNLSSDMESVKGSISKIPQYSEKASNYYEGFDKIYNYSDFVILTVPKDGTDQINQIDINGGNYKTKKGVGIGSSFDDVKAAYGNGFSQAGSVYSYYAYTASTEYIPCLYFKIEDNKVVSFSYYNNLMPR